MPAMMAARTSRRRRSTRMGRVRSPRSHHLPSFEPGAPASGFLHFKETDDADFPDRHRDIQ